MKPLNLKLTALTILCCSYSFAKPAFAQVAANKEDKAQVTAASTQVTAKKQNDKTKSYRDIPAPHGGFLLKPKALGFRFELGYPFAVMEIGYGVSKRFQLLAGYRGFYGMTHGGYGGAKFLLKTNAKETIALSTSLIGGYTYVRMRDSYHSYYGDDYDYQPTSYESVLVGGDSGFGEASLGLTVRNGRHAMIGNVGVRVSHVTKNSEIFEGKAGVLATGFAELGYEVRFHENASYFIALGTDVFVNTAEDNLPAMVRFRNGITVNF